MQNNITPRLPTLYSRCHKLHEEIVALSGLSEEVLADAHLELRECIAYWHSDHKDLAVEDPYEGLCLMMADWQMPWPAMEDSSLNGLNQSQFLLAFAYGEIELALSILVQRPTKGTRDTPAFDDDDAACFVLYAGKAYAQAKQIITSGLDGIAQQTLELKAA